MTAADRAEGRRLYEAWEAATTAPLAIWQPADTAMTKWLRNHAAALLNDADELAELKRLRRET